MGYRENDFTRPQWRAALHTAIPAGQLRRAVAANGRATRDRLWPRQWLLGALLAWYFQADWGLPAILGWLHGGHGPTEAAAYQARARLGWRPLAWLRRHAIRWLADPTQDPSGFYRGRRLVGLDGTTLTAADTPANVRTFGRAGNQHRPSGFPVVRVLALCELGTHALVHWIARRYRAGEGTLAARLPRHVPAGSLLLGDRNFHRYGLWATAATRGFDLLVRVQRGPKFPVRERLADGSYRSEVRPRRGAGRGAGPIPVRVIVYELRQSGRVVPGRLLTSLATVADGTADELVALYHQRWEQESAFREFKGELTGRVTHLRAQSPVIALAELDALLIGHYAVRGLILRAAREAGVTPVAVSFAGTIRVLQTRLGTAPGGGRALARWRAALLHAIARQRVRPRRRRSYPRVRKVVRCPWPIKRPHHRQERPEPFAERLRIVA